MPSYASRRQSIGGIRAALLGSAKHEDQKIAIASAILLRSRFPEPHMLIYLLRTVATFLRRAGEQFRLKRRHPAIADDPKRFHGKDPAHPQPMRSRKTSAVLGGYVAELDRSGGLELEQDHYEAFALGLLVIL